MKNLNYCHSKVLFKYFLLLLSCCCVLTVSAFRPPEANKGNVTFVAKAVPSGFADQIELVYKLRDSDTTVSAVLTFVSGYRSSEQIDYGIYDLLEAKVLTGNTNVEYEVSATPSFVSSASESIVEVTVIATRVATPQPIETNPDENITVERVQGGVKIFGKDGILQVQSWPTLILAVILGGILVYNKFRKNL